MRYLIFTAMALGLPAGLLTQERPKPGHAGKPVPGATSPAAPRQLEAPIVKAVEALAEQMRQHPSRPATGAGRIGLLLIDPNGGEATLIAEEPEAGLNRCGSPVWSHDGTRILFDATPGNKNYVFSRIKGLELAGGHLAMTDLGPGNCPDLSPADDRVIFVLNSGAVPGEGAGVWLMKADGSARRKLGEFGRPRWSPDGHHLMIISFSDPCELTMIDVRPGSKSGPLQLPGLKIFAVPSWAGEDTLVAVIGEEEGDEIALLDVRDPEHGKVKEVLWRRNGQGPDVKPCDPAYSPVTRRCFFAGKHEGKGYALYAIERGAADPPKRIEADGFDNILLDLTLSPDGRYLVARSDRTDRRRVAGR